METTIKQQVALDEALVHRTQRCPFFKAFLVTADVPEIYMQELWATAYVHQRSIRFKLDNKKHIVNLETFRDMLHICPRIPGQSFDELPFEEEILEFLRQETHISQLGGSGTDEGTGSKPGVPDEERLNEEEEADELYRDIDINQGRGLQLSQDIKDSHVTLTPVHLDGQQESSSVSS
nr:hypothetical protein [Tanacetum cinerariifolium]